MVEKANVDQSVDQEMATDGPAEAQTDDAMSSQSRRDFIKTATVATGAAAVGAIGNEVMHELDLVKPAHAAEGNIEGTPVAGKWWPSRWGEGDQTGATNHMTPRGGP